MNNQSIACTFYDREDRTGSSRISAEEFLAWSFWSRAELHAELYLNFCLNYV
jgi:hypothetical protein